MSRGKLSNNATKRALADLSKLLWSNVSTKFLVDNCHKNVVKTFFLQNYYTPKPSCHNTVTGEMQNVTVKSKLSLACS